MEHNFKVIEDIKFEDDRYMPTQNEINEIIKDSPNLSRIIVIQYLYFHKKNPHYFKYGILGKKVPTAKQIRQAKKTHLVKQVISPESGALQDDSPKMTQEEANRYVEEKINNYNLKYNINEYSEKDSLH